MRKIHVIPLAILLVIFLFYPVKRLVSPDWTVQVTDENGNSVASAKVTELWFDTPPSGHVHHEDQLSGPDGVVHFKPHVYNTGAGMQVLGCAIETVALLYHGSCGTDATVNVFKCGYGYSSKTDVDRFFGGHEWHDNPRDLSTTLFLRHCANGGTGRDCNTLPNLNCRKG